MVKNDKIKVFRKYNDFDNSNREVVEIDEETWNNLPTSKKQEYKYLMTRDKQQVKPPKGPTDHDLLLMLVKELKEFKGEFNEFKCEMQEFKGDVVDKFNRIDSELKEFKSEFNEFKDYVLDVFKRNNLK